MESGLPQRRLRRHSRRSTDAQKAETLILSGKSYRLKEAQERAARNAKSRAEKKPRKT
jgi:hypothetical protein